MNTDLTRVVVVDEQQMFADIIQHLIDAEPDLGVIGTMTNDTDLPTFLGEHQTDVVLLDYDLNSGGAAAIARRVRNEQPRTQVVMLMNAPSGASTREAIAAGCLGVVSKDRGAADLLNAIRSAARGQSVAAISNLDMIFCETGDAPGDQVSLTNRQSEILELMAQGLSTDALAAKLFVSRNTIRSHVHQILTKLEARSKLEAVASARRLGIIA